MNDTLNFTVTKLGHIHHRISGPGWEVVERVNPGFTLAYAESGTAHYILNDQVTPVTPGSILFFKRDVPHTGWADQANPWVYFSFGFDLLFLDDTSEQSISEFDTLFHAQDQVRISSIFYAIYRTWNAQKPGYYLETRRLIMELLQEILCQRQEEPLTDMQRLRINQAIQYLHENVYCSNTVSDLAKVAGFSESYFSKLFRQMTGTSVIQYQNQIRLNYARDLIQFQGYSVTEAASALGFNDVFYFSRLYKKMMGVPPSGVEKKKSGEIE